MLFWQAVIFLLVFFLVCLDFFYATSVFLLPVDLPNSSRNFLILRLAKLRVEAPATPVLLDGHVQNLLLTTLVHFVVVVNLAKNLRPRIVLFFSSCSCVSICWLFASIYLPPNPMPRSSSWSLRVNDTPNSFNLLASVPTTP